MNEKKLEALVIDSRKRGIDSRNDLEDNLIMFSDTSMRGSMIMKTEVEENNRVVVNQIYEDYVEVNKKIPSIDDLCWGIEDYNDEIIREYVAIETAELYGNTMSEDELFKLIDERAEEEINSIYSSGSNFYYNLIAKIYRNQNTKVKPKGEMIIGTANIEDFLLNFYEEDRLENDILSEITRISDRMYFEDTNLYIGSDNTIINKHLLTFGIARIGSKTVLFPEEVIS